MSSSARGCGAEQGIPVHGFRFAPPVATVCRLRDLCWQRFLPRERLHITAKTGFCIVDTLWPRITFKAMNITLPRNLEDYVAELVQTSGYQGSEEVVPEALSEHQARRQGMEVVMTPEFERLLDEGLE